jgi:hypothetical protein
MFTDDDKRVLKLFCDTCDGVASRRFLSDFHKRPHHILVGTLPDGTGVNEYPRYDDDDFRAFMTDYRKLRLEQDDTCLFKIMNLLKWKGDSNDRAFLDGLKDEIKEEGRSWWGAVDRDQNGNQHFLTQEQVENLLLYGEIVHTDRKDELQRVIGQPSYLKAVAFFNYVRFARVVVGCAQKTAELIRSRGYLT